MICNKSRLLLIILLLGLLLGTGSCTSIPIKHFEVETREFVYDTVTIEVQPTTFNSAHDWQWIEFKVLLDEHNICQYSDIRLIHQKPVLEPRIAWWRYEINFFEQHHRKFRDTDLKDRDLTTWMAFIPGHFVQPGYQNVIGLQFNGNSSLIIGYQSSSKVRVLTMFHEFLHGIGLVDRKNRSEPPINKDRPNHCNDSSCVMFWQLDSKQKLCLKCQGDLLKLRR